MIFRNYTPFPHLVFESRDEKKRDFGVLVLRGTFEIVAGQALKPLPAQEPVVMADQYYGAPGASSLVLENNLAPYKPKSDIHLTAVAHAPGKLPATGWPVAVEVGKIRKILSVTGPRFWTKGLAGWSLTDPLPVAEVPILYENSYGGTWQESGKSATCEGNPVGAGLAGPEALAGQKPLAAPSILPPDTPTPALNKDMKVEGLGPIAPGWQPRLQHAGTFDAVWEKTRWPDLPEDFKFDFYNSAHPDLVYPGFLRGNEPVRLTNLTPSGKLSFKLPDYLVAMLFRFEDGQIVPGPMQLDSLHIDVPKMRAYLVWRGIYPLGKPMRVLEARMRLHASRIATTATTAPPPQS